jgi:hypothetical protein
LNWHDKATQPGVNFSLQRPRDNLMAVGDASRLNRCLKHIIHDHSGSEQIAGNMLPRA